MCSEQFQKKYCKQRRTGNPNCVINPNLWSSNFHNPYTELQMQQINDSESLLTCSNVTWGFEGGVFLCFKEVSVYRKTGLFFMSQRANSTNILHALAVQGICWEQLRKVWKTYLQFMKGYMTYLQQAPPGLEHEKQTFRPLPLPLWFWFLQVRNYSVTHCRSDWSVNKDNGLGIKTSCFQYAIYLSNSHKNT